jgi:hypothetical protein
MSEQIQLSLDFGHDSTNAKSGLDLWLEQRAARTKALARELGLPLQHHVEMTLLNGMRLIGRLELAHDSLWLEADSTEFRIGSVTFTRAEIESCVRE